MDHRCLYGHRVSSRLEFAIHQRLCPTCGAPSVTVEGYKLARKLADEASLEPVQAFNVVRLVENNFVLAPRPTLSAPDRVEKEIDLREHDTGVNGSGDSSATESRPNA